MATPLDLVLGLGQPAGQLAQAYAANQPVSGTRANILDYLQKVSAGQMTPDEARVMYQSEVQGMTPTPRADVMGQAPVQPQPTTGLSAAPGSFQMPSAPPPQAAAPAPAMAQSAAAPGLAPAPAAPAVSTAEGGLDAAPAPVTSQYVPSRARDAQAVLGMRTPEITPSQVSTDMTRYDQAQQRLRQMAQPSRPKVPPPQFNITQVKNREYDEVKTLLQNAIKAPEVGKMELELFKAAAGLEKQKQRDVSRANLENMDAQNKAALAQAQLQQETDSDAQKFFFDYYQLQNQMKERQWAANATMKPELRAKYIAHSDSLRASVAKVVNSPWGMTEQGRLFIEDAQRELRKVQPFLDMWMTMQPGSANVPFTVDADAPKPEVLAAPPPEAPKPAPTKTTGGSSKTTKTRGGQPPPGMTIQQRIEWFRQQGGK
jgi:hypothetical protein